MLACVHDKMLLSLTIQNAILLQDTNCPKLGMDHYQWTLGARIADETIPTPNGSASDIHDSTKMTSLNYSLPPYGGPYYCITAPVKNPLEPYIWPNAVTKPTPTIIVEMWYNISDGSDLHGGIMDRIHALVKEVICPNLDNVW